MATERWRVGRKLGRTLYAQQGPEPGDDDPFLGLMETPELAAEVVALRAKAARYEEALDGMRTTLEIAVPAGSVDWGLGEQLLATTRAALNGAAE